MSGALSKETVVAAVDTGTTSYPAAPFGPSERYGEFAGCAAYLPDIAAGGSNEVYEGVRRLFADLGLDRENLGTDRWNPLRDVVQPGDNVVIKPNLVIDRHPLGGEGVEAMLTHPAVIRPIIDYLLLATGGECDITICDVPLQGAVWEKLVVANGLEAMVEHFRSAGHPVRLLDLRYEVALVNGEGVYYRRIRKERDPLGYAAVDLGEKSRLREIIDDSAKLEITDYGPGTVARHHNRERNEYCISKTVLNADLFINVPKLKTHRKAGVTLSMKNMVGINGDKSWIAHHRRGVDESPSFNLSRFARWYVSRFLKMYAPAWLVTAAYRLHRIVFLKGKSLKEHGMKHGTILMEGNWHGNDTVWRTVIDLNNVILFADRDGVMRDERQRRYMTVIDGVIGMEREAPTEGTPKPCGWLFGGFNPVAVDYVAAHAMGFDCAKIPVIREAFGDANFDLAPFTPDRIEVPGLPSWRETNLRFEPNRGWKGYIERETPNR